MGALIAGRYRLEEQVGLGGMGLVWRATDEELGRVVAVKRSHLTGPRGGRQVRREARIAAVLQHPHVVTLYDVVPDGDDRWLVMEYLPWRSLAQLVGATGPLSPRRTAALGAQLAGALEALHDKGIVHCDVKPGNVLVADGGVAKLTDFGLSRQLTEDAALGDGRLRGTPAYLAPEVANGREPTAASDVFSLGATLYAAVEGVSPFGSSDSPAALQRRSRSGAIAPPVRAGAPLARVLAAMLAPDPAARPTAAQARARLTAVAQPRRRVRPRARRTPVAVALLVVLAVVALAAGGDIPRAAAVPAVGAAATADPCALLSPDRLGRYGRVDVETDYGNFNRCDAIVQRSAGPDVDVRAELAVGALPPGHRTYVAGMPVIAAPAGDDECDRVVVIGDGYQVYVTAELLADGTASLCGMADTGTAAAVDALRKGTLPRRATGFPAGSLARVDACRLLRGAPGVDTSTAERGFAGWDCAWDGTGDTDIRLRFDRNEPLTTEDGSPVTLAGHTGYVQPDGDGGGTCLVQVVQRRYGDPHGQPTEELVYLVVHGHGHGSRYCATATRLARTAAARLPHP
ncbi:serine/threonine-protein kinase [Actinocatenispora rupis]|nr:serine/threonine-protein kinase [Actinocatenispora rupis]